MNMNFLNATRNAEELKMIDKAQGRIVHSFNFKAFVIFLTTLLLTSIAYADRAHTARFSDNGNLDVVIIGNAIMTCANGTSQTNACTNALSTASNGRNDDFTIRYIDIDTDSTTKSSSAASLNIPAGSNVVFAGLYWQGNAVSGANNAQVKLRTPRMGSYTTLNGSVDEAALTLGGTTESYQGFIDVTGWVQAGGNGEYLVADVKSSNANTGASAGWGLAVVYENPNEPLRNVTVFDGFRVIRNNSQSFSVSGFITPYSGPVSSYLYVLAYEGDRAAAAEAFRINGFTLTNALNPSDNFFNGTVSDLGRNVLSRRPSSVNNLMVDIDRVLAPQGAVPNGSTRADIEVASTANEEALMLGVVAFSTELYVPEIFSNVTKRAEDLTPATPLLPGDTVRWHVTLKNTGLDTAIDLQVIDHIPSGLTYKPGSLTVNTGANTGSKTDAAGDDQAEFINGADPRVVVRLGTSASATSGGHLANGAETSFYFDTVVNADVASGTAVENSVVVSYRSQTLPYDVFSAQTGVAYAVVQGAPVIEKSFNPAIVDENELSRMTIIIRNPAGNPFALSDVKFTDTYPAGLVNAGSASPSITCSPGSMAGSLSGGAALGNNIGLATGSNLAVNGLCTISVNVTSATAGTYRNITSSVTSQNAGASAAGASATLSVGKPRVTKSFSAAAIPLNGVAGVTLRVSNPTAVNLTGLTFADELINMSLANTSVTNTCSGGTVEGRIGNGAWGALAAGQTEVRLVGGTINALSTCALTFNVTSSVIGSHPNTSTGVASIQTGSEGPESNTVSLQVIHAPQLLKSFMPASINVGDVAEMRLEIKNLNSAVALSGVQFSDGVSPVYPTGFKHSSDSSPALVCTAGSSASFTGGGSNATSISFSNGNILPNGSCVLTSRVTATAAGSYLNTTSAVSSINAGTSPAASATLVVAQRTMSGEKTFSPSTIAYSPVDATTPNTSSMTITLRANSGGEVTGVNFIDDFPFGLVVGGTSVTGTCSGSMQSRMTGGTWGPVTVGHSSIRWLNGKILNNGSCTIMLPVKSDRTALYNNIIPTVYTGNAGTFGPVSGQLNVIGPAQIAKSFSPASISVASGSTNFSTLTISLSNPTSATVALTDVGFEDVFPADMRIRSSTNAVANSCGGTVQSTNNGTNWRTVTNSDVGIRLTGATLQPGASCAVSISVQGTVAKQYTNTTKPVTSTNGGTGATASAILSVGQIAVGKTLCSGWVVQDAACAMTINLTNNTGGVRTGLELEDIFPEESQTGGKFTLKSATSTNTCGGTLQGRTGSNGAWGSLAVGNTALRLTGGSLPTAGCAIGVSVSAKETLTNTIVAGGVKAGGYSNATPASATINVSMPPIVSKQFSKSRVLMGEVFDMTIKLTNISNVGATGVSFTDLFPTEAGARSFKLANASVTSTCAGTVRGRLGGGSWVTPTVGHTALELTNGAIALGSNCEIKAQVLVDAAGVFTNHTGEVSTTNIGKGASAQATVTVIAPPVASKTFTPNLILANETSLMRIELKNPNATAAINGVSFTETYLADFKNAQDLQLSNSCGGVVTAAPDGNTLSVSNVSLMANASCIIELSVTATRANTYNTSTGAISSLDAGNGAAATAVLTVSAAKPVLSVRKTVQVIQDPVNNSSNPKAIPGSVSEYSVRVSNSGGGTVDSSTLIIDDALPAQVDLFVGHLIPNNGPVAFAGSQTPISGLSWTFSGLSNGSDSVDFSNNNGTSWSYTPVPDADGFDPAVTNIRFRPAGIFNAAQPTAPWAEFKYRVRVK